MPDSTLVGRRSELTRLEGYLAGPHTSAGLVVIAGEGGIGKTRLVDELAARASTSHRVVRGRADEHETVAFGLWLGPLGQLDLPRPGTDASIPTSELRWDVVDLLTSGMRTSGPTLFVLDDLHWADDDSLWILEQVADRVVDADAMIVATTRASAEARAARWHNVYRRADVVALDGLDVSEVSELAGRFGETPADGEALWRRTGGNPLFVRELVQADAGPAATTVDLLAVAIDRAGPEVAGFVSVLALAGAGTPRSILATATARRPDDLDDLFDAARRADLVREVGGEVRIRHDLLAEAAVERLPPAERRRLHAALAEAWGVRSGPAALAASARHRLLALPPGETDARGPGGEARTIGQQAAVTARSLLVDGHASEAAALVRLARTSLDGRPDVDAALLGRLALTESDARSALDDIPAAISTADVAVAFAAEADDPVLQASAEIAASVHHNPMAPDPVRVDRLARVDAALPSSYDEVDPSLRVRLRGRRAVLLTSFPDRQEEARALGDEAVRRARSSGQADVLVQALSDRLFVLATPEDYDARDRAAEEILELSRTTGRAEFARQAQEWRYSARLSSGDLDGALNALMELESSAAIMPSPYWRWAAALRRCGMLAMLGDYEGASSLLVAARQLAAGSVPPAEVSGLEGGMRLNIASLYQRTDNDAFQLYDDNIDSLGDAPVLFLQARFALVEATRDDETAARRRLTPWTGRFRSALGEILGLSTVAVLASTVARLAWQPAAAELRSILRPFSGRLVGGNGIMLDLPVDHYLAELALLEGDIDDAVRGAQAAVELSRRLRLPTLEARALALVGDVAERRGDDAAAASARDAAATLAEPMGMRLHRPRTSTTPEPARATLPSDREVSLRLDSGRWFIDSPFGTGHVANSTGMGQLVRLVIVPDHEVAAVDLAGAAKGGEVVVNSDLGPLLDGRAKREYRNRIAELQAEIDEADANNDPARSEKHRVELDALLGELRAAVGLGGRDRPQGSGNERARINVARNVRRAIAAVSTSVPDLGAHLEVSIRTGHHCTYAPEPAARLTWHVID